MHKTAIAIKNWQLRLCDIVVNNFKKNCPIVLFFSYICNRNRSLNKIVLSRKAEGNGPVTL